MNLPCDGVLSSQVALQVGMIIATRVEPYFDIHVPSTLLEKAKTDGTQFPPLRWLGRSWRIWIPRVHFHAVSSTFLLGDREARAVHSPRP